jgi:protein-S-isoprenylcysteine O-methyltransferase Ste14
MLEKNKKKEDLKNNNNENDIFYKFALLTDPVLSPFAIGTPFIPLNYIINFQKAGTIIIMYILMLYFNNFSLGAWTYLALHGTYGIIWILKDNIFPDKSFQVKVSFIGAICVALVLLLYWVIGFIMMIGWGDQNPSPRKIFSCFFIFSIGLFLMVCTDLQKFITLKYKKGLIDEYFFAINRNCNYFGEVLVYLSFAMCTNRVVCYLILITIWLSIFVNRIYLKECSLRKKDGYEKYRKKSYIFLFKFFDNDFYNFLVYFAIFCFVILCLII